MTTFRHHGPGPSRLSLAQQAAMQAGVLLAKRHRWMEMARAARDAAGDIAFNHDVAARYVGMARSTHMTYLMKLREVAEVTR